MRIKRERNIRKVRRKEVGQPQTEIARQRLCIAYLATESELKYNKTANLIDALCTPEFDTKLHMFPTYASAGTMRKFQILFNWYRALNTNIKKEKPTFLWLSEFKFSFRHVLACRAICMFLPCKVISGPHLLSGDFGLLFPQEKKAPFIMSRNF